MTLGKAGQVLDITWLGKSVGDLEMTHLSCAWSRLLHISVTEQAFWSVHLPRKTAAHSEAVSASPRFPRLLSVSDGLSG